MSEQDPLADATDAAPAAAMTARQTYPQPLLPRNLRNWMMVWYRNYMVWKKLAIPSMIGNLADPMIYLFGLGLGLGLMVGQVDGVSYIAFLAAGTTASSVMMSASFESMYSAFSRMHVQRTWEAIMHAPLTLGDVVLGEIAWAASKAVLSGLAIMLVAGALGYAQMPGALLALPVIVLAGIAFAALAMIVTALAPSYDFFMFYQTLVMTPMLLLSGVFFPLEQLPEGVQAATEVLPLAHAVALIRPLMLGRPIDGAGLHLTVLAAYAVAALVVCLVLLRRRLLR
ncbi:ABC transporter permease [Cupriavidus taiwanensis]|uniref:Transport permease protein n=3 Tax=Cupriavidus TaxID=106589 RepID=A0A375IC84_9BURK|nr:ABC transporter permease [Cupriavidus taiwanensis]BAN83883.1 permease protein of ABC transporter [Cupriavidus sp. RMp3114]BAN83890.1 permease protein of ABC transporter [Cupriavidus sp. RMp3122]SOY46970.1 putative ABC TRANSPORTER, membrane component [Cupriavidus taiwanensis]SOY47149.1 putative ABC TRANSPORTER, membrane component [Cupriavidus taiwanensis]SOY82399.1 putative ABC TRANSPORTER, membrane component [Cupriavidus taiwanensis]